MGMDRPEREPSHAAFVGYQDFVKHRGAASAGSRGFWTICHEFDRIRHHLRRFPESPDRTSTMNTRNKKTRRPAEPKPAEALIDHYREIGQASLQAALICASKKKKKGIEAGRAA
jgi:hypothetical protein